MAPDSVNPATGGDWYTLNAPINAGSSAITSANDGFNPDLSEKDIALMLPEAPADTMPSVGAASHSGAGIFAAVDGNGIVGIIAAVAYNIIGADIRAGVSRAVQAQAQAVDGIAAYQYAGSRRYNCKSGVGLAKLTLGLLYRYSDRLGVYGEGVRFFALCVGAGT